MTSVRFLKLGNNTGNETQTHHVSKMPPKSKKEKSRNHVASQMSAWWPVACVFDYVHVLISAGMSAHWGCCTHWCKWEHKCPGCSGLLSDTYSDTLWRVPQCNVLSQLLPQFVLGCFFTRSAEAKSSQSWGQLMAGALLGGSVGVSSLNASDCRSAEKQLRCVYIVVFKHFTSIVCCFMIPAEFAVLLPR